MRKERIASYDFDEDAAGLAPFINGVVPGLPDEECVVYVRDQDGNHARLAYFERETLTDGSTVVNLYIHFNKGI